MVKRAGGSLLLSIRIDREAARPVSTQLCVALRELILSGGFRPGERLPATRTLARELGLSRTTVVEVFERLQSEGLLQSSTGSGTYVSEAPQARPLPAAPPAPPAVQPLARPAPRLSRQLAQAVPLLADRLPHVPRAFTTALPAFDLFPMAQWARLSAKYLRGARAQIMGYGDPDGEPQLRRAVAAHLRANRGIACDAGRIFIVAGAQQAFQLIAAALLDPGEKVWIEDPGAIGARNSLIACGAELVPVPVDDEGLRVDEGLRLSPRFRLAFTTPSHQHPIGSVMSLARRQALLQAAQAAGAWVVEDDYDGEFFFGGRPPPTLHSVDTQGQVIYVGTFSKSLFPALRLGYLLVPPELVDTFRTMLRRFASGVPLHTQSVVAEFLDEGHFAAHVRRMRAVYEERHAALLEAGRRHLEGLLQVVPTASGLHTVALLADGLDAADVAQQAEQRELTASPIARFALGAGAPNGLVLGFGGVTPARIDAAAQVLAGVLEDERRRVRLAAGRRRA